MMRLIRASMHTFSLCPTHGWFLARLHIFAVHMPHYHHSRGRASCSFGASGLTLFPLLAFTTDIFPFPRLEGRAIDPPDIIRRQ